jgi:hypothetical protein
MTGVKARTARVGRVKLIMASVVVV